MDRRLALALLLALSLTAPALAAPKGVTIEHPWMRMIIKARPAAGYFTLRNNSDKPVVLTGASSSACGMAMLHQSKEENGVEKMLPVKSVIGEAARHAQVRARQLSRHVHEAEHVSRQERAHDA